MTATLKRLSRTIFAVLGAVLMLAACAAILTPGRIEAEDLPVVDVPESIEGNVTWSNDSVYVVDNNTNIYAGATLTIEAGTIIKIDGGRLEIRGGTVDINGTSSEQVIITSIEDDSVGGDSGNDGSTVGSPGDYTKAIYGISGAISAEYVTIRYGNYSVDIQGGMSSASITDSVFNSTLIVNGEAAPIQLQRNIFDVATGYAIRVESYANVSGITLSGPQANTFYGTNEKRALYLSGASITSSHTWSVPQGIVLRVSNIEVKGTLNLEPGVIVKANTGSTNRVIEVEQGGSLNVNGTSADPVVITSIKDDTVGGDTAGDGPTTPGPTDYNAAVWDNGAQEIGITNSIIKYGTRSFFTYCSGGSNSINITDNQLGGTVGLNNCSLDQYSLERNSFSGLNGYAVDAQNVELSDIVLSGVDKNSFSGTGRQNAIFVSGSVPSNSTWAVSEASGVLLVIRSLVTEGGLDVDGGVVFKHVNTGWTAGKIKVVSGGVLNINGGSGTAVFTNLNDDSVGGDTGGDGPTNGSIGGYINGAITIHSGASADIKNAAIKYVDTAAYIGGQANFGNVGVSHVNKGLEVYGHAIFRGSFHDITNRAITACNFGSSSCSVDAAFVDWGQATGPFVSSGQNLVCGRVTVSPWIVGSSTTSGDLFDVKNCDNSPTPDQVLATNAANAHDAVADARIDCDNGMQDACDAIADYLACFGAAIQLASSQSPIPVTFDNPTETVDTVAGTTANAANTYIQGLESETVGGFNMNVATGILNVVNLYNSLSSAYNSCSP
jgi:hypothetical protein